MIVGLGGKQLDDVPGLLAALRERKPGDRVQLTVIRDGGRKQLTVTLGAGRAASGGRAGRG